MRVVLRAVLFVVLLSVAQGSAQDFGLPNVTPRGVATLGADKTSEGCKQTVMVPDPANGSGLLAVVLAWERDEPDVVSLQTMVRYENALLGIEPTLIFDAPDYVAGVLADPDVFQRLVLNGVSRKYSFESTGYVPRQAQEFFEVYLSLADTAAFLSSSSVQSFLVAGNRFAEFVYTEPFLTEMALGFGIQCFDAISGVGHEAGAARNDTGHPSVNEVDELVLGNPSECGREGVNWGGGGDAASGVAYSIVLAVDCTLRLLGMIGESKYVLAETSERYELVFVDLVGDFDGDGLEDVLFSYAMAGNCCAPFRTIASVLRDGTIRKVRLPGGMWLDPEYVSGVFYGDLRDTHVSFRYHAGHIVDLEEVAKVVLQAVVEVTLDDVIANDWEDVEVNVDIDGDGVFEVLSCNGFRYMGCALYRADGTLLAGFPYTCDRRFGQLPTNTNGYSDFVCNHNTVMRWDGSEYLAVDD